MSSKEITLSKKKYVPGNGYNKPAKMPMLQLATKKQQND